MKDLWADLNVDDDDEGLGWSLEQLERELAHLDDETTDTSTPTDAPPGLSAASLVVSHAQDRNPFYQTQQTPTQTPSMLSADAWSLSLANFSALSLETDFLAADSARKSVPSTPGLSSAFLAEAEDYNVAEQLQAPPGILSTQMIQLSKPKYPTRTPQNSMRQLFSNQTPQNSMTHMPDDDLPTMATPQNSMAQILDEDLPKADQGVLIEKLEQVPEHNNPKIPFPMPTNSLVVPQGMMSPQKGVMSPSPPPPQMIMSPQQGMMLPQGMPMMSPQMIQTMQIQQHMQMMQIHQQFTIPSPQGMPMGAPVMAQPMPNKESAWQTRPAMPQAPRIYANVHPNAPPIPASVLESSLMTARDLAYVIHSLLKPVLMTGTSTTDYHMRMLQRQTGPATAMTNNKEKLENIMTSRAKKAAEWKDTKKILGTTTKADVTRPRALIATPILVSDEDMEQKSRASLWKARLYIDQGYQAMNALVEVWQCHAPGSPIPAEVQTHLLKLFKCLGMSVKDGAYTIQPEKALTPILKMTKGQIFIARLMEQALLPPKAVLTLLPHALEISIESGTASEMTDSRLFGGYSHVISSIPLEGETILACIQKVQTKAALQSQARMECVYALLRVGGVQGAQDPDGFGPTWKEAEASFMQLLS